MDLPWQYNPGENSRHNFPKTPDLCTGPTRARLPPALINPGGTVVEDPLEHSGGGGRRPRNDDGYLLCHSGSVLFSLGISLRPGLQPPQRGYRRKGQIRWDRLPPGGHRLRGRWHRLYRPIRPPSQSPPDILRHIGIAGSLLDVPLGANSWTKERPAFGLGISLGPHRVLYGPGLPGREMGDDEPGVGVEGISPHHLGGYALRQPDGCIVRGTDEFL